MIRHRHRLLLMLLLPAGAGAADWSVVPTLRTRLAYSDNIFLTPAPASQGEWSAEVAPGVLLRAVGPRLLLALDYSLQQTLYQHQADRRSQQLRATLHTEALPEWVSIDASHSIANQNISAFGQQSITDSQLTANRSAVHTSTFSPSLQHDWRGVAALLIRYDYQHVGSGRLLNMHSSDHYVRLTSWRDPAGWSWELVADRKRIRDGRLPAVSMSDTHLTLSLPVTSSLSANVSDGYEKNDYASLSGTPAGRYWSVGGSWNPSPRTSIAFSSGRRFFGRSQMLDASYRMHRMFWSAHYGDDITTSHEQLLNLPPSALGDFLNQLWLTRIPDPTLRQQTIKALLGLAELLGPTGNVNYFSHRYFLQKQWSLSTVYSASRSTLSMAWTRSDRRAQTSSNVDSVLLGPGELQLEDHTQQQALQAGWNWQLSPRSSLNLSASANTVRSVSTGRRDRNQAVLVSLSHQLQTGVSLSADLRQLRHTSNAGGHYRERGASLTLSMQF